MYATSYDPAAADVFSVNASVPLALTSAQIYETGVKQLFWDNRAEWTFAAYDITRRNVYVQTSDTTYSLAGEIATKGIELAGAVRPIENFKLWANVALTQARYEDFDNVVDPVTGAVVSWTGNTPSNVAPIIINAGASYRFDASGSGRSRSAARCAMSETVIFMRTTPRPWTPIQRRTSMRSSIFPARILVGRRFKAARFTFRVRNLTNAVYAAFSDPGYPDQVYLGDPRTYEVAAHFKW